MIMIIMQIKIFNITTFASIMLAFEKPDRFGKPVRFKV